MRALATLLQTIAVLLVVATASAQSLGNVIFQPTGAQVYQAAFDASPPPIDPIPASDTIGFTIQAWGWATVVVSGVPTTGFQIVANYQSNARGTVSSVVLSPQQQTVFDGFVRRSARVQVSYQLVLTGPLTPGTFDITVTYHLVGANSVTNSIRVTIPPVVALHLDGGQTVAFNYQNDPAAYMAAWGSTLPPTAAGTSLQAIQVYGNGGYVVSASGAPAGAPKQAGVLPVSKLSILGHALATTPVTLVTSTDGTKGLVTIATPADYALAVDGTELAGNYQFTVEYSATSP